MRPSITAAIVAASLATAAQTAHAQFGSLGGGGSTRPIRIAFGGGVSVPTGDYKKAFDNGINGQGSIIFNLGGLPLNLRADLSYNRFSIEETFMAPGGAGPVEADITHQLIGALGNVTLPLGTGPVRPYIMAGLGAVNFRATTEATGAAEDDETDTSTKFAINGGAGIALRFFGLDAFVEAKLQNVYTDEGAIDVKSIRIVPLTFGIVF